MYIETLGLAAEPFAPTPDPAFLYLTPQHREALAALEYGLRERRGFVTLVGEVGTGKTTVLYTLMESLGDAIDSAFLTHTTLEYEDLLRAALVDLGVPEPGNTKGELIATLNRFLHDQSDRGRITALVIDEAQNLSLSTLEELRLLTDYETFEHKLLQIVLVGQPELDQRLNDPQVRQLRDRIAVRARLIPLQAADVPTYIDHRLHVAGSSARSLFTGRAISAIAKWSGGNPRRINTLCHNSLLAAYGQHERKVGRALVRLAIDDLEARDARMSLWGWYRRALRSLRPGRPSQKPRPSTAARGWWRRLAIATAAGLIVIAASVLQLRSHEPAAAPPATPDVAAPLPRKQRDSDLRSRAYGALDAIIPKHQYLEWERRRHGYRE